MALDSQSLSFSDKIEKELQDEWLQEAARSRLCLEIARLRIEIQELKQELNERP